MSSPDITVAPRTNLADRESRAAFIGKILEAEAHVSTASFGTADYTNEVGRLAEAFADIVGDRKGPYRDQHEKSGIIQRLSDAGWGFLAGVGHDNPNNRMLQAWVVAVVEGIDANFGRRE